MAKLMSDNAGPDDFKDAVSTSHLLHRVQQLASDRFAFLVGDNGVTLRQFVVMTAIAETPDVSQVDLVRRTGVDRSTLADMLTRLERRGWIARKTSDTDARANAVRLTDAGFETLTAARQHAKAADAAILDPLPNPNRKSFLNLLTKLSDHVEKEAKKQEREAKRLAKKEAKLKARERKKARAEKAKEKAKADKSKKKPRAKKNAR